MSAGSGVGDGDDVARRGGEGASTTGVLGMMGTVLDGNGSSVVDGGVGAAGSILFHRGVPFVDDSVCCSVLV